MRKVEATPPNDRPTLIMPASSSTIRSQNWCCRTMVISCGYCAFSRGGMTVSGMIGAEGQVEMMLARQPVLGGDMLQRLHHHMAQRRLGPVVVGQEAFGGLFLPGVAVVFHRRLVAEGRCIAPGGAGERVGADFAAAQWPTGQPDSLVCAGKWAKAQGKLGTTGQVGGFCCPGPPEPRLSLMQRQRAPLIVIGTCDMAR